jgi:hypothetical protein
MIIVHSNEQAHGSKNDALFLKGLIAESRDLLASIDVETQCHQDSAGPSGTRAMKSGDVRMALIVFSVTDIGKSDAGKSINKRASQQLVLELGYLTALLGGQRVIVLADPRIEAPENLNGAHMIITDQEGEWKSRLKRAVQAICDSSPKKKRPFWRDRNPGPPTVSAPETGSIGGGEQEEKRGVESD